MTTRRVTTEAQLKDCKGGALVPTMGALHEAHLELVRRAASLGTHVVVSIFVNPTQFNEREDFDRYPRDLERDIERAAAAGAEFVFAPEVEVIYPPGRDIPVPTLPEIATRPGLEDHFRPGHFQGVCQVVARLFDLLQPRYAVFGEKDYQQLKVIEALVSREAPRWGDLEIIPHPTKRETDGLAMSSRNQLMSPDERARSLGIPRALEAICTEDALGRDPRRLEEHMRAILVRHQLAIEYAVIRSARDLMPVEVIDRACRALIAARAGNVRLIDNEALGDDSASADSERTIHVTQATSRRARG